MLVIAPPGTWYFSFRGQCEVTAGFNPTTVTRFAIREEYESDPEPGPKVLLSTLMCVGDHTDFYDIGRVAVLTDDRARDEAGRHCVLLVLHSVRLCHRELHQHVANVCLSLTRGARTDMTFLPVRDLLEFSPQIVLPRARVSVYTTDNGGNTWHVQDVTHLVNDFVYNDWGAVVVRTGNRVACLEPGDLLGRLALNQPVVDDRGVMVEPNVVLTTFTPSDQVVPPDFSVFSIFDGVTSVYKNGQRIGCYEADTGCMVLNLREPSEDGPRYLGISQSGDCLYAGPLGSVNICRVSA